MKPGTLADRLGQVREEIASLSHREEYLGRALINTGVEEVEGRLFRAVVISSEVEHVDYRAICQRLAVSHQLRRAHTQYGERVQIRVTPQRPGRHGTQPPKYG